MTETTEAESICRLIEDTAAELLLTGAYGKAAMLMMAAVLCPLGPAPLADPSPFDQPVQSLLRALRQRQEGEDDPVVTVEEKGERCASSSSSLDSCGTEPFDCRETSSPELSPRFPPNQPNSTDRGYCSSSPDYSPASPTLAASTDLPDWRYRW